MCVGVWVCGFPLAVTLGLAVCVTFSGVCLSVDRCVLFVCLLSEDCSVDRFNSVVSGGSEAKSHTHSSPPLQSSLVDSRVSQPIHEVIYLSNYLL